MAFVSGKSGFVTLFDENGTGGGVWPFKRWRKKNRTKILSRNNFRSGGKDESVAGFQGCDIVLEGPYDTANPMFLQDGELYLAVLGIEDSGPTLFSVVIRVESIEMDNDAEDGPMWVVTGQSHGDFDSTVPQLTF